MRGALARAKGRHNFSLMPIIGVHVLRFTMFFNATITGLELFLARFSSREDMSLFTRVKLLVGLI